MAQIVLKNIKKVYPNERGRRGLFGRRREEERKSNLEVTSEGVVAVQDFDLTVGDGEFVVLVGPSGCGKSTTLRMIAGLEDISSGDLLIDGRRVNDVAPKDRDIAMVFQSYALYPNMTVYENMAFTLRLKKVDPAEIDRKVRDAAETLGITPYLDRKPKALSGGQRQRVAIGRAIVRDPKVFLMDEPLSNLDAKLRNQMRAELIKLRHKVSGTFIYVTHDQTEAMTLGDRIVIMKDGYVQQIGTPQEVFNHPANLFVAGFIGMPQMNFFDAHLVHVGNEYHLETSDHDIALAPQTCNRLSESWVDGTSEVVAGVRPEQISLAREDDPDAISGTVEVSELMGSTVHVHVTVEGSELVLVIPTVDFEREGGSFADGERISFKFDQNAIHLFDKQSGNNLVRP
ncbi:ABC transporter ATP-binding protein [uncultured Olsenella sp.]|uniref:ABC transporter ATP-binding protein n=1 Tax=uncultured Olsenella sp. TaxID=190764 RepID=UPI0026DCB546|nr:ABC transporter ATP-binding protein [uncultured Olsenella sp.]